MSESKAFDWICAGLEDATCFNRVEARGTIRLALREAGLEAASVTASQLLVVVEQILPRELESRGIADAGAVCEALARGLAEAKPGAHDREGPTPDEVFRRLAG